VTHPDRITKDFLRSEYACRCGRCENRISIRIASAVQGIRDILGAPVRINSGYRCEAHNRAVGGEPNSKHCEGIAADLSSEAGWRAIYEAALRIPAITGIGVYPSANFVHVDVRPEPARWAYIDGKKAPFEAALEVRV
jgi:uncharacterized protein YcbK (DUF882 family)